MWSRVVESFREPLFAELAKHVKGKICLVMKLFLHIPSTQSQQVNNMLFTCSCICFGPFDVTFIDTPIGRFNVAFKQISPHTFFLWKMWTPCPFNLKAEALCAACTAIAYLHDTCIITHTYTYPCMYITSIYPNRFRPFSPTTSIIIPILFC